MTIFHNYPQKLLILPARSSPSSKTLISQLAEKPLSHYLSKLCKLEGKKFAQISLRATLFFPGKAIGGKNCPAMMCGMGLAAILDFNRGDPGYEFLSMTSYSSQSLQSTQLTPSRNLSPGNTNVQCGTNRPIFLLNGLALLAVGLLDIQTLKCWEIITSLSLVTATIQSLKRSLVRR